MKVKILIVGVCFMILTGCVQPPRLKQRAIIMAVGIDLSEDGEYIVTAQKFSPEGGGSSTMIDASKVNDMIMQGTGKSITQAMNDIQVKHGKELFFGSNDFIIFGKELAEQGIEPVLSFFNASYEQRPTATVMLAENSAQEIIGNEVTQGLMPSFSLATLNQHAKGVSSVGQIGFYTVMGNIVSGSRDSYMPIVKADENIKGEPIYKIIGTGVFKEDTLVKEFHHQESQAMLWMKGDIGGNYLMVEDDNENLYSIYINTNNAICSVDIEDGSAVFEYYITGTGELREVINPTTSKHNMDIIEDVTLIAEDQVEEWAMNFIEETALDGIDIMNLGDLLAQREPAFYKEHQETINDEIKKATYRVKVNLHVDKVGLDANRNS